jgi:dihydroxy-acid dehydratase
LWSWRVRRWASSASAASDGTSASWPSPEAAVGGGLALLRTGDRVRIDLNKRTVDILISDEELEKRRQELEAGGGYKYPESQTPWQEIERAYVDQLSNGMVLKNAVKYQRIAATKGLPREHFSSPLELLLQDPSLALQVCANDQAPRA